MINAKEAKTISRSVNLDAQILDKISYTIVEASSKGKYNTSITSILYNLPNDYDYVEYLRELGYEVKYRNYGIHVYWQ